MKVGTVMPLARLRIHPDDDTEESRNLRHEAPISRSAPTIGGGLSTSTIGSGRRTVLPVSGARSVPAPPAWLGRCSQLCCFFIFVKGRSGPRIGFSTQVILLKVGANGVTLFPRPTICIRINSCATKLLDETIFPSHEFREVGILSLEIAGEKTAGIGPRPRAPAWPPPGTRG